MARTHVIEVMGMPIQVVIHDEDAVELEGGRLRGSMRCSEAAMHLDGRVAPFVLVTTFFHELIHLLDFELSDGEMTEAQVKALAVGLASVFGGVVNQLLGVRQTEEGTDESR